MKNKNDELVKEIENVLLDGASTVGDRELRYIRRMAKSIESLTKRRELVLCEMLLNSDNPIFECEIIYKELKSQLTENGGNK